MTIAELQLHIADQLRTVSDAPELDAQRILLHVLKKHNASYLFAHGEDTPTQDQQENIGAMASERATGMPLAYILGEADFYGRTFLVNPNVLIPRPDTEALIEKSLQYVAKNFSNKKEIIIADICTGSGIIAITLALELPQAKIIATDISRAALEVAKQNARTHGVENRIEFIQGDLLEPIKNKKIDLIVSNPPYVPSDELAFSSALKIEQKKIEKIGLDFEPWIALDGGTDGLKFVNQIKEFAKANNIPAIIETVGGEIEVI